MRLLKLKRRITNEQDEFLRGNGKKSKRRTAKVRDYDKDLFVHCKDGEVKAVKEEDGSLLFWLFPNAFEPGDVARAYAHLTTVNGDATSRPEVIEGDVVFRPRSDGSISNQSRIDLRVSKAYWKKGIRADYLGYMDPSGSERYCRQTAWTAKNPEVLSNIWPMLYTADEMFQRYLPEAYLSQADHVESVPDFRLRNTVFSTVTVNKKLSTTYHRDQNDYKKGFGVMFTLGKFKGGQLVFPAFRCAVDYQPGSIILADVHETHGNVKNIKGNRITCVLYAREHIDECGSAEEVEARMAGTMSIHARED